MNFSYRSISNEQAHRDINRHEITDGETSQNFTTEVVSEFVPFGLIKFIKSKRAVRLNNLIPIQ